MGKNGQGMEIISHVERVNVCLAEIQRVTEKAGIIPAEKK
jgi:hypothetical protein